jgi:hypothetical protein
VTDADSPRILILTRASRLVTRAFPPVSSPPLRPPDYRPALTRHRRVCSVAPTAHCRFSILPR